LSFLIFLSHSLLLLRLATHNAPTRASGQSRPEGPRADARGSAEACQRRLCLLLPWPPGGGYQNLATENPSRHGEDKYINGGVELTNYVNVDKIRSVSGELIAHQSLTKTSLIKKLFQVSRIDRFWIILFAMCYTFI
jgi:hypothetical protein